MIVLDISEVWLLALKLLELSTSLIWEKGFFRSLSNSKVIFLHKEKWKFYKSNFVTIFRDTITKTCKKDSLPKCSEDCLLEDTSIINKIHNWYLQILSYPPANLSTKISNYILKKNGNCLNYFIPLKASLFDLDALWISNTFYSSKCWISIEFCPSSKFLLSKATRLRQK